MHVCRDINTWDQPISHCSSSRHDLRCLGHRFCHAWRIDLDGDAGTIHLVITDRWYPKSSGPTSSRVDPSESDYWGGINPGFKLQPIMKIIFGKLILRKWIMRSCPVYRHAKLMLIRRHQRQIMPTKLRMTSSAKTRPCVISIIIKHCCTLRDLWWLMLAWRNGDLTIHDDQISRNSQITLPWCDLLWCLIIVSLDGILHSCWLV